MSHLCMSRQDPIKCLHARLHVSSLAVPLLVTTQAATRPVSLQALLTSHLPRVGIAKALVRFARLTDLSTSPWAGPGSGPQQLCMVNMTLSMQLACDNTDNSTNSYSLCPCPSPDTAVLASLAADQSAYLSGSRPVPNHGKRCMQSASWPLICKCHTNVCIDRHTGHCKSASVPRIQLPLRHV